jgi:hypothetical protein
MFGLGYDNFFFRSLLNLLVHIFSTSLPQSAKSVRQNTVRYASKKLPNRLSTKKVAIGLQELYFLQHGWPQPSQQSDHF